MKSENGEIKVESIPKMEKSEINLYIKEYKAYSKIVSNLTDSRRKIKRKNKRLKRKLKMQRMKIYPLKMQ